MLKRKLYDGLGMALLRIPAGKRDRENKKRRDVVDLGQTTAAQMLSVTGICPDAPLLLSGRHNKTFPILRQLVKMAAVPCLLIGTRRDLEQSCLLGLDLDWTSETPGSRLSKGSGALCLRPGAETSLALKEYLPGWDTHLSVLCLGNGLQVDTELLNLLNGTGRYILLSEALGRSVKGSEGSKLTLEELLLSMDYIVISSIGMAAKELVAALPSYECEKVTNITDFSLHQDSPQSSIEGHHHRNGGGFRLSQSRSLEPKPILTQDDLRSMQNNNTVMIYNARAAHTWVARIVR